MIGYIQLPKSQFDVKEGESINDESGFLFHILCDPVKRDFKNDEKYHNAIIVSEMLAVKQEDHWISQRITILKLLSYDEMIECCTPSFSVSTIGDFWYTNGHPGRNYQIPGFKHGCLPSTVSESGKQYWYTNGYVHSINDCPAIICPDGTKEWQVNGVLHRGNDLPAIEYAHGTRQWWQHGVLHRDDGKPAIIQSDGTCEWYFHGAKCDGPSIA